VITAQSNADHAPFANCCKINDSAGAPRQIIGDPDDCGKYWARRAHLSMSLIGVVVLVLNDLTDITRIGFRHALF
jgi:hypothetical protein